MKVLASRILQAEQERQHSEMAADRKSQVGSGDRSERIRTYNYPQGRITDHRVNVTVYSLERFMDGEIQGIVDELASFAQAENSKRKTSPDTRYPHRQSGKKHILYFICTITE